MSSAIKSFKKYQMKSDLKVLKDLKVQILKNGFKSI